jgi:hypothetical protein
VRIRTAKWFHGQPVLKLTQVRALILLAGSKVRRGVEKRGTGEDDSALTSKLSSLRFVK